ncbi:hypothetical protein GCM10008967_17250 [Bacillus carboniphilus]|uniref:Uncharacterized protein n=1 Tax=Bacillus carboniphilus TaxID=86663 RepID=A0ABN0W701_9BACI
MNFSFKSASLGAKLIVVSTIAAIISLFLPWVDLGLFGTASGFQQEGYLLLIPFIYPVYRVLKGLSLNRVIGLICGVIAIIGSILFLSSKSVDFMGETINGAGSGLYLCVAAAVLLTVGVFLDKPKQV